jgi:hypothetical protein
MQIASVTCFELYTVQRTFFRLNAHSATRLIAYVAILLLCSFTDGIAFKNTMGLNKGVHKRAIPTRQIVL